MTSNLADERHGWWTVCPYCGHQHGDSAERNADMKSNLTECDECGKYFWQWAEYDVDYCTAKLTKLEQENLKIAEHNLAELEKHAGDAA